MMSRMLRMQVVGVLAGVGTLFASAWNPVAAAEGASRAVVVAGVVYEDQDGDGTRDLGEPGLAGLSVSNGEAFTTTGDDGAFELGADEAIGGTVFVCTPSGWRASKRFYIVADFESHGGGTQRGDIGLVRDRARAAQRFCFVQLSDTHVTEKGDAVETMKQDLDVVNRLTDRPVFLVTTGDLVNRGKRTEQLASYVEATQAAKYPLYNVVGNHDYGGERWQTEHYERFCGPRYYSFDVGHIHFIAKDIIARERDKPAYERQKKWIREDIQRNAKGKRLIVFQHFLPTNNGLDKWAEYDTLAIFSGHWHGSRERSYKGILDVNSAPFRFGGIDRSPRGFRIVHIDGNDVRCEWRIGQQDQYVAIVHPPVDGVAGGSTVPIRVAAYDTAVRVRKATFRIFDGDGDPGTAKSVGEGRLTADGAWNWAGSWTVPVDVSPGRKRIEVQVTGADGSHWRADGAFELVRRGPAAPAMGEPWRFFHGDAGHRGYVERGPKPPLALAWTAHVGGTIHVGGPVIADGCVYVGTHFRESLDDCAVVALDLATGKTLWRKGVDSSIIHSPAAWGDNVLAVSQAGTLYCFGRDGNCRWTAPLGSEKERWELSCPVTDGHAVYAGRSAGFGAYDLKTGKPLWKKDGGRDWWPSVYSGPSLGTGLVYQGGPFVRALDPATGDIRWNRQKVAVSTVAVVPAVVERGEKGDRLYVFQNKNTLLCLDGASGETIWQGHRPGSAADAVVDLGDETGTPAVGDDVVCIGGAWVRGDAAEGPSAAMHAFDKATGELRWRYAVERGIVSSVPYQRGEATITSSPVIVGDVVYFGATDGTLYALSVDSGKPIWRFKLGVPIASTAAVSGNTLVVGGWDGHVYAFTASE